MKSQFLKKPFSIAAALYFIIALLEVCYLIITLLSNYPFSLRILEILTPVLILLLIHNNKTGKARSKKIIVSLCIILGTLKAFNIISLCFSFAQNTNFDDIYQFTVSGGSISIFYICSSVTQCILYFSSATRIHNNQPKARKLEITACALVAIPLFILFAMSLFEFELLNFIALLSSVLSIVAICFLPKVFIDYDSAPKIHLDTLITCILILTLIFVVVYWIVVEPDFSSNDKSYECKSCGRSFESGANATNIAKTGMCKNCENNYHWGEQFID